MAPENSKDDPKVLPRLSRIPDVVDKVHDSGRLMLVLKRFKSYVYVVTMLQCERLWAAGT